MTVLIHGNMGFAVKTEPKKKPVLVILDLNTNEAHEVATFKSAEAAELFRELLLKNVAGELRDI